MLAIALKMNYIMTERRKNSIALEKDCGYTAFDSLC